MVEFRKFSLGSVVNEIYVITNEKIPDKVVSSVREKVTVHIGSKLPYDLSSEETHKKCLITFSTGIIISENQMKKFGGGCWNIHPASYNYPGRDPHHFASYDKAISYGACVHKMEAIVDSGEILMAIENIVNPESMTPEVYHKMGKEKGLILLRMCLQKLSEDGFIASENNGLYRWGERKTKRSDLKELCRITPGMEKEEIENRIRACICNKHNNLWLDEEELTN
jgi:methionyl-tRNA formyltransferase